MFLTLSLPSKSNVVLDHWLTLTIDNLIATYLIEVVGNFSCNQYYKILRITSSNRSLTISNYNYNLSENSAVLKRLKLNVN